MCCAGSCVRSFAAACTGAGRVVDGGGRDERVQARMDSAMLEEHIDDCARLTRRLVSTPVECEESNVCAGRVALVRGARILPCMSLARAIL